MDIPALQARLRQFAAERDWPPFHNPKNLAMALVVEAAELVEIFQWLTPAQSAEAGRDAATHERIGDEVADVLLYLLQLADQAGVDVDAAVARKLVKNALKHPVPAAAGDRGPAPGDQDGARAAAAAALTPGPAPAGSSRA